MLKYIVSATLAVATLLATASADAQQQIRPAAKSAAWMAANGWDGKKVTQTDGRVRTDWFCGGNVMPDGSCQRGTVSQAAVGNTPTAAPASTPAPQGQGTAPNFVPIDPATQAFLDEQRRKDAAAAKPVAAVAAPVSRPPLPLPTPVAVPAPQAAPAPASVGGCWIKHPLSKTALVDLLQMNTAAPAWYANMCMTPENWVRSFERMHNWQNASSVSVFSQNLDHLVERDCRDSYLKNMVFVSPTGQKTPAGKCQENEVLLVNNVSDTPIFALVAGKPLVAKDAIFKP